MDPSGLAVIRARSRGNKIATPGRFRRHFFNIFFLLFKHRDGHIDAHFNYMNSSIKRNVVIFTLNKFADRVDTPVRRTKMATRGHVNFPPEFFLTFYLTLKQYRDSHSLFEIIKKLDTGEATCVSPAMSCINAS